MEGGGRVEGLEGRENNEKICKTWRRRLAWYLEWGAGMEPCTGLSQARAVCFQDKY